MNSLKVYLHNSAKQKIAKFSIGNSFQENILDLDKKAVSDLRKLCLVALEMAQDNMLFDLSSLSKKDQDFISAILNQLIEEGIAKGQLFTHHTKPTLLCPQKEIKPESNDLLDTNAVSYPPAVFEEAQLAALRRLG